MLLTTYGDNDNIKFHREKTVASQGESVMEQSNGYLISDGMLKKMKKGVDTKRDT